jgi:predicted alpha/beta superfamily hydrolase
MHNLPARLGACLLLLVMATTPVAAEERVLQSLYSLNPSHYHRLEPEALGRPIHVVVKLPRDYSETGEALYPVIYLLDGGAIFPMLVGYYNYLLNEELVPEAILVGLSYGAPDFEGGNYRGTDYTAPSDEREWWGGAEVFQQVLERDLFPLVESAYRTEPTRRILFGQSIGGQFVLFSALTRPELFWGRIASNPALHRNLDFFLDRHWSEAGPESKLFVSSASGDDPRFRVPAKAWIDHWNGRESLPWSLRAVTIEGYGHFSVITEAFRRGVLWLFD